MRRLATGLALAVISCGPAAGGDGADAEATYAGVSEALPPQAPARFGFGSAADAARVAMWDQDVKPDGEGLPVGRGTVEQGRQVFGTYCMECHGATGTEGPNDRLAGGEPWVENAPQGRTIGNYWQYATTLYDYIHRAMPQLTPGLLTSDQTYAVIAYVLYLNEIVPEDAVMNAETLPAVVMPARDHFVVDDREGGSGPIR
jgi:cytochrome c